jgi:hypothetical protein
MLAFTLPRTGRKLVVIIRSSKPKCMPSSTWRWWLLSFSNNNNSGLLHIRMLHFRLRHGGLVMHYALYQSMNLLILRSCDASYILRQYKLIWWWWSDVAQDYIDENNKYHNVKNGLRNTCIDPTQTKTKQVNGEYFASSCKQEPTPRAMKSSTVS